LEEPSAAVRAFIDAYVESIDSLRVLLLLARHPDRTWRVEDVSAGTALAPEAVLAQLQRLTATGLMVVAEDAPPAYRYSPRAAEFDEMVRELIELDDRRPVTLIRLVYARKSSSAQAFADAFRLRRS
jgi:hypothetical protein